MFMMPFCRRVEEAKESIEEIAKNGLKREEKELLIYIMCVIPSNVVLAEEFCRLVDGISKGSNDLTQLTLGVNRDSEILAKDFDERGLAVKKMVAMSIEGTKKSGRHSGLFDQAPSDYPEFPEFLVKGG